MPTRTILDWTPEQVGGAILQADAGQLSRAADLCERLMCDARVRGILGTRTHGLFGLPLNFNGPSRQVKVLKGTEDAPGAWWDMFPEAELAKLTSWGIVLGVGLAQRIRDEDRQVGEPDVPSIRVWHPRWLRYQYATTASPEQWFLQTMSGEIPITPGDGEWILYTPYGEHRPWAEGAWRALAEAWILKQFAKSDRARFTEVAGTPVRVGLAPQGATEKTRKSWLRSLKAMGRDTAMVLPAGYDIKAVNIGGDGWQIYGATIQLSDEDIAITLTGQLVTTQGTTGFSDGNVHEKISQSLIKFTAESLATTLHDQALRPWAGANFGDTTNVAYACWDTVPPEDKKVKAETMGAFADAATKVNGVLAAVGKRLDLLEMAEDFGLALEDVPETPEAPSIPLAPTDVAKVVRVDEARAGAGLPAWGGEDGQLTVTQFDQKNAPKAPNPFAPAGAPGAPGGAPPFTKSDGGPPMPPPPVGPKPLQMQPEVP